MATNFAGAVGRSLLALHRRLLPPDPRIGWIPYLWLFWLVAFFAKWFFVPLEPIELTLALLTLPVFLALYLNAFWHSGRRVFINIAGVLLIALVWTPFNPNAFGFFIYAGSLVGRADRPPRAYQPVVKAPLHSTGHASRLNCVVPRLNMPNILPRHALSAGRLTGLGATRGFTTGCYAWLAGVVLLIAIEWLAFDLPILVLLFGGALSLLIGTVSIHTDELDRQEAALKLSQAEARRLAAVAERERIGRDLHDLLGHTLSLITIKAALAAKLASRGDGRSEQEIREVERISRGALREKREAVSGLRRSDLDAELANARLACEAGGVSLTVDRPPFDLSPDRQAVLALCLREAITNVVRHAAAGCCRASLVREDGWIRLTVEDDGRGGAIREGAGLAGMRERVERAGGVLTIATTRGVTLTVRIPATAQRPASGVATSAEAAT